MRVKVLFLVLLIGVVGSPSLGHAEKVKTNQSAKVYNRPGERGKVVVKVKEGQGMTVLAKEGRWIKVRVSGRTGYIPRSKVDMSDDEEISRNTRRRPFVDGRSTKRGFGGSDIAPDDRIGADATGDGGDGSDDSGDTGDDSGDDEPEVKPKGKKPKGGDDEDPIEPKGGGDDEEPTDSGDGEDEAPADDRIRARVSAKTTMYDEADKDSDEAFKATPSDVLFVVEKKGKWTLVETDEGEIGYVLTSKLEIDEGGDEGGGGGKGGRIIDVRGRLGVTLVSQTLQSRGGGAVWPDKYKVGSSAATVALGGAVLYPYGKKFLVGGELAYDIAKAIPGVAFDPDGTMGPMPKSTTGFTIHNLNLRAVGGYDLKKKSGMMLFARVGFHYESFLVASVTDLTKNSARLPSEVIKGPMIGAALSIPRISNTIGLRLSIDVLVGASVTQTKNLEDGANPTAKRITFGTGLTYRWKPGMDIQATYDLNYASLSFGAPVATSMRNHMGTGVARTDLNHTVAVGIEKAF
jgi:hypothetical protein